MNMTSIRYIIEVAKWGTINKAARNLHISQPALSREIKKTEDEIGVMIFSRTTNGINVTPQGREFICLAEKLYEYYLLIQEKYCSQQQPNALVLTIASVRYALVGKAFINIYNRYRHFKLHNACVSETDINTVIELVYAGCYSLGILLVSSDAVEHWKSIAKRYNIEWITLYSSLSYLQVGKHHPLAHKTSVCLNELKPYPHATMANCDVSTILSCSEINEYNVHNTEKRIVVNDRSMMYDVLTETDAYYIGGNLEKVSPYKEMLNYIPISDTDVSIKYVVIYSGYHILTPLEKDFIKEFSSLLKQTAPELVNT